MLRLLLATCLSAANPLMESLPQTSGTITTAGLEAVITIERDDRGVPSISGDSLGDVIFGQGFVHAQDRYFQMDMMRRYAAGELAEVGGAALVAQDRAMRPYQFRKRAQDVLANLSDFERDLLQHYVDGVNAGLASLKAAPPEYAATFQQPEPWALEDCVLVMFSMFDQLSLNARFEPRLQVMRDTLPPELFRFLTPTTDRFDAPLINNSGDNDPNAHAPLPIPGEDIINLRDYTRISAADHLVDVSEFALGSNNWAVADSRSAGSGAMLASDPHLFLAVPAIWYQMQLRWKDGRAVGATLPGTPGIVIGSNAHVAWGLTNTMGDFQDLIIIETNPEDANQYKTPDGFEPFERETETIRVRLGKPVELELRKTRWGTVTGRDYRGRPLVLKWTALEPQCINFNLFRMLTARNVDEAIDIGHQWYGPSQNMVIADSDGRIGWVVTGYLPKRIGFDGSVPVSWADGAAKWDGALDESKRPSLVDPPDGIIYTANNRTVPSDWAATIGRTWAPPIRAHRIRELLLQSQSHTEADLLQIQLDTRVQQYDFYRDLILEATQDTGDETLLHARRAVEQWDGCANTTSIGLPLLVEFRESVHRRLIGALVSDCQKADPTFRYWWLLDDEPVRRILEERPLHMLPIAYEDWLEFLRDRVMTACSNLTFRRIAVDAEWGASNESVIEHPFSAAFPLMKDRLNMPHEPMAGEWSAVRVAEETFQGCFGASMRLVVSPGNEDAGIMQLPTGQSGHLYSPHYRDGFESWLRGEAQPLQPREAQETLTLAPAP